MLFIPLFENAFKHGNLEDIKNGWLTARLHIENNQLHFQIQNTFEKNTKKDKKRRHRIS